MPRQHLIDFLFIVETPDVTEETPAEHQRGVKDDTKEASQTDEEGSTSPSTLAEVIPSAETAGDDSVRLSDGDIIRVITTEDFIPLNEEIISSVNVSAEETPRSKPGYDVIVLGTVAEEPAILDTARQEDHDETTIIRRHGPKDETVVITTTTTTPQITQEASDSFATVEHLELVTVESYNPEATTTAMAPQELVDDRATNING